MALLDQELRTKVHIELKPEDQLKPEYYGELSGPAIFTCLHCNAQSIRARSLKNEYEPMFKVQYHWLCEVCFKKLVVDIQEPQKESDAEGLLECKVCHRRLDPSGFWALKGVPWLFRCKECYRTYRIELRRIRKDGFIAPPSLNLISRIKRAFRSIIDWDKFENHNDTPLMESLGFTFIHHGLSRGVYKSKDGKYVLKTEVARHPWQNRNEIVNYDNFDSRQKKLFAKIFACDSENHHWILAERAKTRDAGELSESELEELRKKVRRLLTKNNIQMTDVHSGNIGYIGKRPVIIDYGFQDISDGNKHDTGRND